MRSIIFTACSIATAVLLASACGDRNHVLGTVADAPGAPTLGLAGAAGTAGDPILGLAGAGPGGDELQACASAQYTAPLKPLELYILLDQSGSMKETEDRMTPVINAISTFVKSDRARGISAALQYFALGKTDSQKCSASTYVTPAVPPSALPGGADALIASLNAHNFPQSECCTNDNEHNGTPTQPAVEAALAYLSARLQPAANHVAALLLATDGLPTQDCSDNTIDDVARTIATARQAEPPVPTYVIGIGALDSLAALADAGGTGRAPLLVDGSGSNIESEFSSALDEVRAQALPCDFAVPGDRQVAEDRVNVTYSPPGSKQPVTAYYITDASRCDPASDEWYYVTRQAERRIQLCPRLCDSVTQGSQGQVNVVVGCKTQVK